MQLRTMFFCSLAPDPAPLAPPRTAPPPAAWPTASRWPVATARAAPTPAPIAAPPAALPPGCGEVGLIALRVRRGLWIDDRPVGAAGERKNQQRGGGEGCADGHRESS